MISVEDKIKLRSAINDICSFLDQEPNWQDGAHEERTFSERDLHLLIDAKFEKSVFGNVWSGYTSDGSYCVNFTNKGAMWYVTKPGTFNHCIGTVTYSEAKELLK